MPRKDAPEFYWSEKREQYRKRIKDDANHRWVDVWGSTKAELREKVKQREAELKEAADVATQMPVYAYAATWYKLNTATVGAKRRDDYRNAINNHICPIIGQMPIADVKPDDIRRVMLAAPASKSSQQKIVTTLKRIFAAAEDNDLVKRSPCRDLKAGGAPTEEKKPLTGAQQTALLAAVKGCAVEPFVALCLYAGLRREEALGLQWDAVHLDAEAPYLEVKRALHWDGKNRPKLDEKLKSRAAYRNLPLPPPLVDCLKGLEHKGAYVVHNQSGGPVSATGFRRLWDAIRIRSVRDVTHVEEGKPVTTRLKLGDTVPKHKIIVSLDFGVTPHQLRHTYITELIMSGAGIKTVQYLAGHSTVQLTLDIYTHYMANTPADTMPAVMGAFGGQRPGDKNAE